MTNRSDRRNAELAVIEAARKAWQTLVGLGVAYMPEYIGLTQSLLRLEAVPLPDASAARSSRGAPLTSQNAAAYMNGGRATSMSARIVRRLHGPGGHIYGMTVEELCDSLNKPHQTVSARVHDLKETGWLRGTDDYTRTTRSGSEAIVWRLSDQALHELRAAEGQHRERII